MARDFSVYERAMGRMAARDQQRSSGGGDFVWYSTNKPSRKGESTRARIRIVPRPDGNGGSHEEFWISIDQHMVRTEGKTKALVCPDDHDNQQSEKRCPLCKLSRDLYASRDPEMLGTAKEANARQRVFCNVVDLDDDQHPEAPKVWGFSRTMHHSILDICMAKRSFVEDLETGRDLFLTTRRIGPQKFDIRYAVTDADSAAIDPAYLDIAQAAHDLESLGKPASLDELHEIAAQMDPRKGSKRGSYTPTAERGDWGSPAAAEPAPSAPPSAPAKAAPEAPASTDDKVWHYSGPDGQQEGMSTAEVAAAVRRAPGADHHVWRDGMSGWEATQDVPEIGALLATRAAPPAPPTGGPPAPPSPRGGSAF